MATAPRPNPAPVPTLAVVPPPDIAGDFADAFKELTAEENEPKIAEPGTDPVVEGAAATQAATEAAAKEPVKIEIEGLPDPTKVGADGKVVVDPAAAGATGAAAPAAAGATGGDAPRLTDAEMLERFRQIVAEPPKPAPAAAQGATGAPGPQLDNKPAVSEFTPEQQKLVDDYIRDFPDVYAAEQLIRAREYQAVVAHIFAQIGPHLQALQQQTGQLTTQTHLEKLEAAIPDYAQVVPKVFEWIEKQPAYLKAAYQSVASTGGVSDVVDLVNRYRAETGTAVPAAAAAAKTIEVPVQQPAVAKVAKALAPVAGKRTGVQTDAIAMDDFDGAFGAFAGAA